MNIFHALIISIAINMLLFLPAYFFKTDKLTDVSYSLTFVVLALLAISTGGVTASSLILLLMILIWAARLGSYLFLRIKKIGKDKRFDDMRGNFWSFGRFWLFQALTVWLVLLPSLMFFDRGVSEVSIFTFLGVAIWLAGFLIEAVADYQKYIFKNDPTNKEKWIESGLWKYSRHPNYFGEILVWLGIYTFTLSGLTIGQSFFGLLSPIYIAYILTFVSGVPLLEKAADRRWGDNQDYQDYKKRTSPIFPLPR